jgi:dynactin complex subunit
MKGHTLSHILLAGGDAFAKQARVFPCKGTPAAFVRPHCSSILNGGQSVKRRRGEESVTSMIHNTSIRNVRSASRLSVLGGRYWVVGVLLSS